MITEIVKNIQAKPAQVVPVSRDVRLDINFLGGNDEAETKATVAAVRRMNNDELQQFAKLLKDTILATRNYEADKRTKAEEELTTLFGKEVLKHAAVTQSRDGFFYSLTREGTQFRCWYASFGSVTRNHFDSCGSGCLFSAECDSHEALKDWITPFVTDMAEWESARHCGRIWMGSISRM